MSDPDRLRERLQLLAQALQRLKEAMERSPEDSLVLDATIQRFEFTFELLWKALKNALEVEGFQPMTPRETIKQAYQAQWLQGEDLWLKMLKDRHLSSHTYHEEAARRIYRRISAYVPEIEALLQFLQTRF